MRGKYFFFEIRIQLVHTEKSYEWLMQLLLGAFFIKGVAFTLICEVLRKILFMIFAAMEADMSGSGYSEDKKKKKPNKRCNQRLFIINSSWCGCS